MFLSFERGRAFIVIVVASVVVVAVVLSLVFSSSSFHGGIPPQLNLSSAYFSFEVFFSPPIPCFGHLGLVSSLQLGCCCWKKSTRKATNAATDFLCFFSFTFFPNEKRGPVFFFASFCCRAPLLVLPPRPNSNGAHEQGNTFLQGLERDF